MGYRVVDVTRECGLILNGGSQPNWLCGEQCGDLYADGVCSNKAYTWYINHNGFIHIEKRIKASPKPDEVCINIWAKGHSRHAVPLGSKNISYKSAVELGLIKEADDD